MEKIKKGDEVVVITGKDKGKRGTVLSRSGEEVQVITVVAVCRTDGMIAFRHQYSIVVVGHQDLGSARGGDDDGSHGGKVVHPVAEVKAPAGRGLAPRPGSGRPAAGAAANVFLGPFRCRCDRSYFSCSFSMALGRFLPRQ